MSTYATNRNAGGGGGGSGTVTSVGLIDESTTPIYTVGGSPVTSYGNLTLTLNAEGANTVFAGPTSGASAEPTFRDLVSADIPNLSSIYVPQSEVGVANGVASLDSGGKVPVSQLPSTVMEYQGNWNPNTNSPTLSDGTGTNGNIYWVSAQRSAAVSGLNNPSMVNFQVGDLVLYSSALGQWQLTTPAAGVSSVNGAQGAVTVNAINQLTGDVTAGPASGSQSVSASLVATSNSTLITLSALSLPTSQLTGDISLTTQVSGILPIANGGTNASTANAGFDNLSPMTTAGDIIYENSTPTAARLPIGTTGQILTVSGGLPSWQSPSIVSYTAPTVTTLIGNSWITGSSSPVNVNAGDVYQDNNNNLFTMETTGTGVSSFTVLGTTYAGPPQTGLNIVSGSGSSFIAPTTTTLTPTTYTAPTSPSPLYLKITMVGGGGGGSGAGTSGAGNGGDGGNTIFGSSLLRANGGGGAIYQNTTGGTGGTATLGSGPTGFALTGATGGGGSYGGTDAQVPGGDGGATALGGAGLGSFGGGTAGENGIAQTGSGGGGGSYGATAADFAGSGGGAAGYVYAFIASPSSSYSYEVGQSGTAGTAGTSGTAGGAGGQGMIVVEAYYQ
jgi:hypothetical protein